ncbi:MAG: (d)CMP kinase [Candidatus Aenigmatarchaeota archaeon]
MTGIEKFEEYERKLRENHQPGEMIFTVSGLPGRGKSTLARFLADEFNLNLFTAGDFHRQEAGKRDLSIGEFMEQIDEIEEREGVDFDLKLDKKILETAYKNDKIVFDSRLAGILLQDVADIRILVECSIENVAERVAQREGWTKEEAREHIEERARVERRRYKEIYGVDLTDRKYYNIVIDNSGPLEETEKELLEKVKQKLD